MKELLETINPIATSVVLLFVSGYVMYLGLKLKEDNRKLAERDKSPKAKKQRPIILMPEDIITAVPPVVLDEWEYQLSEN